MRRGECRPAARSLDSTDQNVNRPLSRATNFWLKTHANKYYVLLRGRERRQMTVVPLEKCAKT